MEFARNLLDTGLLEWLLANEGPPFRLLDDRLVIVSALKLEPDRVGPNTDYLTGIAGYVDAWVERERPNPS
ncbi:MAG: hypothetical protein ACK5PP_11410 [Acidimicrobiales bacterium]